MPDRVALVTGASRGIGRAVALALSTTGPVAINYLSRVEDAKQTLSLIEDAGGEGVIVQGDVGEVRDVDRMFAETEDALGSVAILVNNAGVRADGLALTLSDEAWNAVMRTNLFGTFACSRRALRSMMRARWGRIVNVGSVAGMRGSPGQVNYSAAKAGVIGVTKTLAREVASKGITVNAVAAGLITTDLTSDLSDKSRSRISSEIPQQRPGTPEDVARVIAFLCSEDAGYVTGSVWTTDGGMTA